MVQLAQRTGFTDSALIRLLGRLTDIDVRISPQGTADQLSRWLGWTDAISRSAVLNGSGLPTTQSPRPSTGTEEAECIRVRTALGKAIAENNAFTTDFSLYRQRYLLRQQAMQTRIGPLRAQLRTRLATRSPAMAKLAAMDAVMEQALGAKEHSLLASIPALLEQHFKRVRKAGQAADATDPDAWLEAFRKDFQDLLRAELDFRFQPIEGLLEALRMKRATD